MLAHHTVKSLFRFHCGKTYIRSLRMAVHCIQLIYAPLRATTKSHIKPIMKDDDPIGMC